MRRRARNGSTRQCPARQCFPCLTPSIRWSLWRDRWLPIEGSRPSVMSVPCTRLCSKSGQTSHIKGYDVDNKPVIRMQEMRFGCIRKVQTTLSGPQGLPRGCSVGQSGSRQRVFKYIRRIASGRKPRSFRTAVDDTCAVIKKMIDSIHGSLQVTPWTHAAGQAACFR